MIYTLGGKPLSECSYKELCSEWHGGMYLETASDVFTKEQSERLNAVERAMCDAYDALSDEEKQRLEDEA